MKKKFLVMMYQEGASLLDFENRVGSNFALRRMIADATTAVNAFVDIGAEVYVCDVYGKGRDIFENEFNAPAQKVKTADLEQLCKSGAFRSGFDWNSRNERCGRCFLFLYRK